jgi:hypothetical protein
MGGKTKGGGGYDPRHYGRFEEDSTCQCETENYVTEEIRWVEVPMMSRSEYNNIKAGRWVGGIVTLGRACFHGF